MSVLVPPGSDVFKNGKPAFDFDECYSCFQDRGILFRLVNTEKKRWAFYNDTADLIIKVRAQFGGGSVIKALQRTEMITLLGHEVDATGAEAKPAEKTPTGSENSAAAGKYAYEATLAIEPGFTELFIEGTINGFAMDFSTESAPAKNVKFENGEPSCAYDKMYKCFKEMGNGLLFRLVNESSGFWAFYNDTTEYVMRVSVEFEDVSEVTALGDTHTVSKGEVDPETGAQPAVYSLYVKPGRTEMFVQGKPSTYKLSFAAEPLKAAAPPPEEIVYNNGKPDPEIIPHLSHVYKCFKEHDNGLLFRCVDDVNKIWAFYNDTTTFLMNVNVRFPPKRDGDDVAFAPNVVVMDDVEVPGGYIAATQVAPLQTAPFLVGDLREIKYDLAFSAQEAEKAVPVYENGTPDLSVVEEGRVDEVFKCFKDHGNGLLFRLVTRNNLQAVKEASWAFYNDTVDTTMHITVSFADKAKVKALGRTKIDADDEMGVVYVLDVPPLHTEPFVDGETSSFTTKFTGTKAQ